MRQEAIDTGLSPACKLLVEVDEFSDVGHRVVVGALLRRLGAKHVGDDRGMPNFLIGHVLDEEPLLGIDAVSLPFLNSEVLQTPMEEVKLDPFLVESQS